MTRELPEINIKNFEANPIRLKKFAVKRYVLALHKATGKGSSVIHRILKDQFPKESPVYPYLVNESSIERWINPAFDLEKVREDNPQLYPYLKQLQLINNAVYSTELGNLLIKDRPITGLFSKHAERCLYRFNDPLGEKVDLYAQYCVIREFWARDKVGNTFTEDLDLILDCTTWLYDDENPEETPYNLAVNKDPHKLTPKIKFISWKNHVELRYRIYAFLRISFILHPHNRVNISPDEIRKIPIARPMITEYFRNK